MRVAWECWPEIHYVRQRIAASRWWCDLASVSTGKVFRMLTIVDDCTRECPAIEVETSLGGFRVRRVLGRIAMER